MMEAIFCPAIALSERAFGVLPRWAGLTAAAIMENRALL